jgi:hypothetical protein
LYPNERLVNSSQKASSGTDKTSVLKCFHQKCCNQKSGIQYKSHMS